jgi:hypothetical protein
MIYENGMFVERLKIAYFAIFSNLFLDEWQPWRLWKIAGVKDFRPPTRVFPARAGIQLIVTDDESGRERL